MIRLLIVDDSALMRKLLADVFGRQPDFEVRVARDGVEALEVLGSYRPHVITLDINMPSMDGLTCLDRIVIEYPCPVVMVSALTAEGADATLEALHLGAVDFIAKPDGAISLGIDEITPMLVQKVRGAASARPRNSLRLKERVRHRLARSTRHEAVSTGPIAKQSGRPGNTLIGPDRAADAITGDGLVLVGTSTGGPPALEAVLTALPASFPWPIVVAQHMPASFTGALARRLDGLCALEVTEVSSSIRVRPGCVYIGKGDADIIIVSRGQGLFARPAPMSAEFPWHPSTDRLVRSAMNHLPSGRLIGVLMTGMGSDGALAMADLRASGGRIIAEARETAIVWGMPGELVAANGADWVVPLPEIADCLLRLLA